MSSSTIKSKAPPLIGTMPGTFPGLEISRPEPLSFTNDAVSDTSSVASSDDSQSTLTQSHASVISSPSSASKDVLLPQELLPIPHRGILELNHYAYPVNFLHANSGVTVSVHPQTKVKISATYGAVPPAPDVQVKQSSNDDLSLTSRPSTARTRPGVWQRAWFLTLAFAYTCVAFVKKTIENLKGFFSSKEPPQEQQQQQQRSRSTSATLVSSRASTPIATPKQETQNASINDVLPSTVPALKTPGNAQALMPGSFPTQGSLRQVKLDTQLGDGSATSWKANLLGQSSNLLWAFDKTYDATKNGIIGTQQLLTTALSQTKNILGFVYDKTLGAQNIKPLPESSDRKTVSLTGNTMSVRSMTYKFTNPIDLLLNTESLFGKIITGITIGSIKVEDGEVFADGTGYLFKVIPLPLNPMLRAWKRAFPAGYAEIIPSVETSIEGMLHGNLFSWGHSETVIENKPN